MNRRRFLAVSIASTIASRSSGQDEAEERPILSFGLITDVQYADADPEGERHYRESIPKLRTAVEWLSGKGLPFTLHLGDFIDRDFAGFATLLPLLQPLGHSVRHLLGNHDYTVSDAEKEQVVAALGMARDYYSFRSSGVRFLMIDTNDLSVYKYSQGSPGDLDAEAILGKLVAQKNNSAQPWNGGVSGKQLQWLEGELSAADAAKEPVIICGHHPLLPADGHQAWNSPKIVEMIDRHPCVVAYFNGHFHDGAEVVRKGVAYITFKSMLHEPETNAYSMIRLFRDRLEIEGNGREKSRHIPLRRV